MDHVTRARITELLEEIEHQLANPHDQDHREGLLDKIRDAVEHFETEHPAFTDTLNRIVVALGV